MLEIDTIQGYIDAIDKGYRLELPEIKGYSSIKVRMFLHMINKQFAKHYLEIGVHTGSTFIPAIFGCDAKATCIDNWSRFGNFRPEFESNLEKHSLSNGRVLIIEDDCWKVDLDDIEYHAGKVNVYFYDGEHHSDDQYKAVYYYAPVLADEFILIVDDANYPDVVIMTRKALADRKISVVKEWILPGPFNAVPSSGSIDEYWWNGLLVAICHK